MSAHANQRLILSFLCEAMNSHDIHKIADYAAPDFVFYPRISGIPNTLAGFQQLMTILFMRYPDIEYTPECVRVDGERVVVGWVAEAAHPGSLIGKHGIRIAIGWRLCWYGETRVRVRDGRIEALWSEQDDESLCHQLDQLPDIMIDN